MTRPRLLDLFCGAGGAAMGYHRAGFDVVGVDIKPMPRYPFEFIQMDAIEAIKILLSFGFIPNQYGIYEWKLDDFDVIHASPPCQAYSVTSSLPWVNEYPELIEPVRKLLIESSKSYVIENVIGAPLINPLILCGSMFGLQVIRHRAFETNPVILFAPASCSCRNKNTGSHRGYSSFENGADAITVAGNNYPLKDGLLAMGIDWMANRDELSEAIPPAYTEFIGKQLMRILRDDHSTL